jgi:hypothetical protein
MPMEGLLLLVSCVDYLELFISSVVCFVVADASLGNLVLENCRHSADTKASKQNHPGTNH